MKTFLFLITLLGFFVHSGENWQKTATVGKQVEVFQAKSKTPVLVELFTSEGCATCPPVERNLAVLDREQANPEAEIITLALHVDYWDGMGWTDKYASPLHSQRQTIYGQKFKINSIYTPQMVVDGARHFVGNNLDEVQKAISEAAKNQKASVEISVADAAVKVKISEIPRHEQASVYLAVAENNLMTRVEKGENGGRTLPHASVVRQLKPLGRVLAAENEFLMETALEINPEWKRENLKFVVFIQENQSRRILGVNSLKP